MSTWRFRWAILLALAASIVCSRVTIAAEAFDLRDGDRIVLLGNTLIERDQYYGYLETALITAWPDRNFTFRNLGWSGDNVFGEARAGFGKVPHGFKQLSDLVAAEKPTVIFVSYGTNESFAGEKGLAEFLAGYEKLLDTIGATKARMVLLTPIKQENLGKPLPDPTEQNKRLRLYCDAIQELGKERSLPVVDLYRFVEEVAGDKPLLTDNGIHLSRLGYFHLANYITRELGVPKYEWSVSIDDYSGAQKKESAAGTKLSEISTGRQGVKFTALDTRLPPAYFDQLAAGKENKTPKRVDSDSVLRVQRMPPGKYLLHIDGKPVTDAYDSAEWAKGLPIPPQNDPRQKTVEAIRTALNNKNRLYFYRWRPQNETYLFGFRKHEQGRNAAEVVQFDPLIAEVEAQIAKLRVPVALKYELVPQGEVK